MQLAAVSDPAAIPHDGHEVPASVAEDPNAVEKPSAGPKQIVVSHRPETAPVSLESQVRETAPATAPEQAQAATAAAEQPRAEKQEAPRRRSRFRIGS